MTAIILLKIYLVGVLAGTVFPVMDTLLKKYSTIYYDLTFERTEYKVYRHGPIKYKLYSAILPIFNLAWVFIIIMSIYHIAHIKLIEIRYAAASNIVIWLAKRSNRKYFPLRLKIVGRFFPSHKNFFLNMVLMLHSSEILSSLVDVLVKITQTDSEGNI